MAIQSFRDLTAWQLAMDLAVEVYAVTAGFPRQELYGLAAQVRRAAAGVPSNIAEGHQRGRIGYRYFLRIALGSLAEVDTQIELAERVGFLSRTEAESLRLLIVRLRRVLHGLSRSLRSSNAPDP